MEILFWLGFGLMCFLGAKILENFIKDEETGLGVNEEDTKIAKQNYEKALKDKDKVEAVKWGRVYFGNLRWMNGYRVTIYDEQRIQNDINAHC
jgi:hypothetical protein